MDEQPISPLLRLRYLVEYVLIRFCWLVLSLIPASRAYDIGMAVGRRAFRVLGGRRRIAVANVLAAGITDDPTEATRIARDSMGHFVGHLLETVRAGDRIAARWREHVEVDMSEESRRVMMESDEPIMMLSGHLGVWEVAVPVISTFRPMIAVARVMQNPYVESFMAGTHFRGRITVISKNQGFSTQVMRQWETEKAALTIVMDQRAGRSGIWMSFMGRPAKMFTSPARIHLKSGHPIIVGAFVRVGPFRYRMVVGDVIRYAPTGDREADVRAITAQTVAVLESCIRRWPEQYLWAHNRWKEKPPAVSDKQT